MRVVSPGFCWAGTGFVEEGEEWALDIGIAE